MRTIIAMFAVLVTFASSAKAQVKVTSVSAGTGETTISTGLVGIVTLAPQDGSRHIEVAATQSMGWLAYGPQFNGSVKGFATMSAGHFLGAPWAGPYIVLSTNVGPVSVGTVQWPIVFAWKPNGFENAKSQWGHLGGVSATYKAVTLNYALDKFMDDPWNALPGAAVSLPLTQEVGFNTSATWNTNKGHWMFYLGATWTPK
jgi:hypothetical protein